MISHTSPCRHAGDQLGLTVGNRFEYTEPTEIPGLDRKIADHLGDTHPDLPAFEHGCQKPGSHEPILGIGQPLERIIEAL